MLSAWLPDFIDASFIRNLLVSFIFFGILMLIRGVARRAMLKRTGVAATVRQRWLASLRNVIAVVFFLGMALIWASEIETLAVSLVAIAAAIVLATREMILCIMGSIYRSSTDAYGVGDRIEVQSLKGLVIDSDMFSTTLIESMQAVGSKSTVGRVVTFPNSLLLSNPVWNETRLGHYVLHNIHVNISRGEDWLAAEKALLEAANQEIEKYSQDLSRHARELQRGHGLESPALEPRVVINLDHREDIGLHLQLAVPLGQRAQIEQRILRTALTTVQAQRQKQAQEKAP